MKTINMSPNGYNVLGRLGENEHTQAVFDVADILEQYSSAVTEGAGV